ncbi:hypothetical protein GCM10009675_17270 [Prauserella alba]|uniref:Uncharacterized protein n=1 Tax=Prauserella alba TaxID=176898 RepID=A0ABN1VBW2_9PSEU
MFTFGSSAAPAPVPAPPVGPEFPAAAHMGRLTITAAAARPVTAVDTGRFAFIRFLLPAVVRCWEEQWRTGEVSGTCWAILLTPYDTG